MILKSIKLLNFRNLKGNYPLYKGVNIIVAENGAGKTNFIEAVALLTSGKSFRTRNEVNILKQEGGVRKEKFFRVEGDFVDDLGNTMMRSVIVEENHEDKIKKVVKINNNNKRVTFFNRDLPEVIFSPNSIDLVLGSPSVRRRDIDDFLSLADEEYFNELKEYKTILRNRNRLLDLIKKGESRPEQLSFWNDKLVESGSRIVFKRKLFLKQVRKILLDLSTEIFSLEKADLFLRYSSSSVMSDEITKISEEFRGKITNNKEKEYYAGVSLYGPHRDDILLFLNGDLLSEFGSRGQQRVCSFIYKLSQAKYLKKRLDSYPILLLDDLFSEVDSETSRRIEIYLEDLSSQIVITAVNKEKLNRSFIENANAIELSRS